MWILTPLQPEGEYHYLLSGKEYLVGRKNCDIVLPNDQSISRSHAHLTASDQTLTLKDTSKYGTFVNNQQLTAAPVDLTSGDNVTFGVFHSKFSVLCQKPVVCSSCVDNAGKALLSQALLALGGKLVNTWTQDCTHLAMPTVKVTVKTISALLCCRPIVKPEFFSELNNAVQQKLPLPEAESFIPEIDEPSLNKEDVNLKTIPVRKQLFSGKTFIFLNAKQLKRLSAAVTFGGGKSELLEEESLPRNLLESPHSCVVDVAAGSSQVPSAPLSEWANSVRSIIQRKGRRVIVESEIGLAAIYASCDKYCNPSCPMTGSDDVQKVKPRIPSASLSQNVAVDETVLATTSQNITAYAVNTEQSQRTEICEMTGVMAVGETPDKKQTHSSQIQGPRRAAQTPTTQCMVPDTINSSFNASENKDSQKKKLDSKVAGEGGVDIRPLPPSASKTNSGRKFPYRQSPQKPKTSAQASPQKQSTLSNFFQPVKKKRPLEDELSAVMSEPKRPAPESSITLQASHTPTIPKQMPSFRLSGPAAVSQTPAGSSDMFLGRSESRKRKEIEEEIQIDELESLMSENMDDFDDEPSGCREQQQKPGVHSLTKQKQDQQTRKKQRSDPEENGRSKRKPQMSPGEESFQKNYSERTEEHLVSVKTEQVHSVDQRTTNQGPKKTPEVSSASKSKDITPLEDDDGSLIEDEELLKVDICQPKEEIKASLKPVMIKQEVQESKIDEDLPQKLVMVEFRSLTVTAPPKTRPKQMQDNGHIRNFKCFRKTCITGADGFPHTIRGSDLFVHNKGKNSDLDEWLKDAAEEERQTRRDETLGDDLFRYNPTKITKRR
ncbi:nibrin [Cololabis saira]|uniref:nibrin n=1 Tax=Cololabis saira TaxID=129043 RepID=UPI002AD25B3B|nr:nibrin [Cololabis saira]